MPMASGSRRTRTGSSPVAATSTASSISGANYFFYAHKLKVQSGLQWADMNDRANDGGAYSGVSWTTGLRIGW